MELKAYVNKMLFLNKFRNYYRSPYESIGDSQLQLSIAHAFKKVAIALTGKNTFTTAYVGSSLFWITEGLSDLGFVLKDPLKSFFGNDPNDPLHVYNSIENIEENDFDVIFLESTKMIGYEKILEKLQTKSSFLFDLDLLFTKFKQTLGSIKSRNFQTCLHVNKLAILSVMAYLCPKRCRVIEVGSYQCGTTIFMAKLLNFLKKQCKVYALDTFSGIPAASDEDKIDVVYYDTGMFQDVDITKVTRKIKSEKVDHYIELIKGNVCETLPKLVADESKFDFMFLDTDQYKGTKSGLQAAYHLEVPYIVVDDTCLLSVDKAINEFLLDHSNYSRAKLITNFDLIFLNDYL